MRSWVRLAAVVLSLSAVGAGEAGLRLEFDVSAPEARIAVRPSWVTVFPYGSSDAAVSYRFEAGRWAEAVDDHLKLSGADEPGCDEDDRRDDPVERNVRDAIPSNARVKAVKRLPSGRIAIVYSVPAPPESGSGHLEVWLATLRPGKNDSLDRVASIEVFHPGTYEGFCRLELLKGNTLLVINREAIVNEMGLTAYAFSMLK